MWTGIVGANGAGKTTLLKLAAGAFAPTEEHIRQISSARLTVSRWQLTQSGNTVRLTMGSSIPDRT